MNDNLLTPDQIINRNVALRKVEPIIKSIREKHNPTNLYELMNHYAVETNTTFTIINMFDRDIHLMR